MSLTPVLFGTLLQGTGIWTTCGMFFSALAIVCLVWMYVVVQCMLRAKAPEEAEDIDERHTAGEPGLSPA